jgi:hypothetical protein
MALPRPLIDDGVVSNDPLARTLTVRPSPHARACTKVLWREAVRAQGKADAPTVWASGAGEYQAAYGRPAEATVDALEFKFPRVNPVYRWLVSMRGLHARIAVDRATGRIIGVTLRGKA